jgi:hypothetical protein
MNRLISLIFCLSACAALFSMHTSSKPLMNSGKRASKAPLSFETEAKTEAQQVDQGKRPQVLGELSQRVAPKDGASRRETGGLTKLFGEDEVKIDRSSQSSACDSLK